MKKTVIFLFLICLFVSCISFSSSALTVNSTYTDVSSTSTQAVNLVNFANSYDDFVTSDYVVYCDEQYSYYIVWGDLNYDGSTIYGIDIQYLHYFRESSGTQYQYRYQYGTDSSFKLTPSNMCTSNLKNFGFSSSTYQDYKQQYYCTCFMIFAGSVLFVVLISHLRRVNKYV